MDTQGEFTLQIKKITHDKTDTDRNVSPLTPVISR